MSIQTGVDLWPPCHPRWRQRGLLSSNSALSLINSQISNLTNIQNTPPIPETSAAWDRFNTLRNEGLFQKQSYWRIGDWINNQYLLYVFFFAFTFKKKTKVKSYTYIYIYIYQYIIYHEFYLQKQCTLQVNHSLTFILTSQKSGT